MATLPGARIDGSGLRKRSAALLVMASVALAIGGLTFEYFLPVALAKMVGAGLFVIAAGLVFFSYPEIGFAAAVFYIYAGLSFYFPFAAAYPIVVLVFTAVSLRVIRGETVRLRAAQYNWAVVVFGVVALQSMLFSYGITESLLSYSLFLKSLLLVFLVVQLVRTPRDLERFAMVILIGSVATIVLGVINIQFGLARDTKMLMDIGWIRFQGTHADPNVSAAYMITALPIGIYGIQRARRARWRVLSVAAVIILVIAVFSTFSRSAMFPLSFVLLTVLFRDVKSKRVYAGILLLAGVIFLVTPAYYWNRLLSISDFVSGLSNDWSLLLRAKALASAWGLFLAHPLTGVGLQNFIVRAPPEMFVRIVVHNSYLEILVGTGIFGLAAYLAIHAAAAGQFVRAMRARWAGEEQWMRHLAFYALVSYLSALVSAIFLSVPFSYLIWIPLAMGIAAGRLASDIPPESEQIG